jgi:hypothetical protein
MHLATALAFAISIPLAASLIRQALHRARQRPPAAALPGHSPPSQDGVATSGGPPGQSLINYVGRFSPWLGNAT